MNRTSFEFMDALSGVYDASFISFYIHTNCPSESGVVLFDSLTSDKGTKYSCDKAVKLGAIYRVDIPRELAEGKTYLFYEKEDYVADRRAFCYAKSKKNQDAPLMQKRALCFSPQPGFDWGDDKRPNISYEDSFWYLLHVKGFTKHPSSGVTGKGTFAGMEQKLSYLKELGITTIEVQPIYEFEDTNPKNYWGYTEGAYYAPKLSYADSTNPVIELKHLIYTMHQMGLELIMQMYFPKDYNQREMSNILRFWVHEYHVDGFHLMGENLPLILLCNDPFLADCKIVSDHADQAILTHTGYYDVKSPRKLAVYRDEYLYGMRRFLKGDENMLGDVVRLMRRNPHDYATINYFSNFGGFTMMDMVSYDRKHNEANGEDNRDGSDYNCSWNCGEEGPSRKQKIAILRNRQLRNALTLLMISAGTPLIFMGDEFQNSQNGNNNPYNVDGPVTQLNWKLAEKNLEQIQFLKYLVSLRKKYKILHMDRELTGLDSLSCGYPDLSYHGDSAWQISMDGYNRYLGLLFCNAYAEQNAKHDAKQQSNLLYIGVNSFWEKKELALPKPPKGFSWQIFCATCDLQDAKIEQLRVLIPPRSIVMLEIAEDTSATKKKDCLKK